MNKPLSPLLSGIEILSTYGMESNGQRSISGLNYDSREIGPGFLFFAFPGLHTDGHNFIEAAIDKGAVAVIHDRELPGHQPDIAYIRVKDARLAMGPVASAFYGHPSQSLCVIGVTGTEGKSTTVYLIYQLLSLMGEKAGFFSTVMADTGSGERPNPQHQTTPEATTVQAHLAAMRDSGCEFAVVESSSHGLSERTGRLADVAFDIGIMTNVTHEHLEFHGTWEQYRSDKANLFRNLDSHDHIKLIKDERKQLPSCGIVNADDPSAGYFEKATSKPVLSYSVKSEATTDSAAACNSPAALRASGIVSDADGCSFTIEAPEPLGSNSARRISLPARINLPGEFNVGNSLAALAAVSTATKTPWPELLPLLPRLRPVKGRMMKIDRGQPFELIIDYAHTPSSFQAILPPLRKRIRGKIICIFGSAGERDTEKRPQQGEIASQFCDILILTDEDPRGEDPMQLLEEIASGCPGLQRGKRLFLIPDRPLAIRRGIAMASPGDAVLLLGKGHENSIIYKDFTMPYDEEAEAIAALSEAGYSSSDEEARMAPAPKES
ncbi:MAG: UDP-N-acetylmuramoyl-L-alanyl-D-glutamate--2,6-diaminopimelate ligase [Spirochaetaceae bacterium]|nr:UDP-N-acetylmuramoyl-L-alanyl-D-glutamate--2,6-diaminopimelate ligase [Spirochaetaceae bacterium]